MGFVYFIAGMIVVGLVSLWQLLRLRKIAKDLRYKSDALFEERDIVLAAIHKFSASFEKGASIREIYDIIIDQALETCDAQGACIYERQADNTWKSVSSKGLFPPQKPIVEKDDKIFLSRSKFVETILQNETLDTNDGLIPEVGKTNKAVHIEDAKNDPRVIRHSDESLQINAMMITPISFRDNVTAVLALVNPVGKNSFSDTNFSLICALAGQGGISIYNANTVDSLVERSKLNFDLKLASSVQQYLLPHEMPMIESLDFAVRYIPQQMIGGDFYDFIKLPNDRLGLLIADVSGKGIPAAMVMTITQTMFRYIAPSYESPAEALKALNREMMSPMRDMFVTMIYAIIDVKSKEIILARAGHEKALFYIASEGGEVEKINSAGMAIGMVVPELFDLAIQDEKFDFPPSSIMVMYTDGITESRNRNGEEFSSSRLEKSIKSCAFESAAEINTGILLDVQRFCGPTYSYADDITLLTIKHKTKE